MATFKIALTLSVNHSLYSKNVNHFWYLISSLTWVYQVQQLLSCVDKCVYSMVDSPTPTGKIVLETAPECEDTISRRLENTAPAYLAECERLIQSWSSTIETVLSDAFEDR